MEVIQKKTYLITKAFLENGKVSTILMLKFRNFTAMYIKIVDNQILFSDSYAVIPLPKAVGGETVLYNFTRELTEIHGAKMYKMYKELTQEYWNINADKKTKMQEYHFSKALKYS